MCILYVCVWLIKLNSLKYAKNLASPLLPQESYVLVGSIRILHNNISPWVWWLLGTQASGDTAQWDNSPMTLETGDLYFGFHISTFVSNRSLTTTILFILLILFDLTSIVWKLESRLTTSIPWPSKPNVFESQFVLLMNRNSWRYKVDLMVLSPSNDCLALPMYRDLCCGLCVQEVLQ